MSSCCGGAKTIDPDPTHTAETLGQLFDILCFVEKSRNWTPEGWGWRYKVTYNKDTGHWEARVRTYEMRD